MAISRRQSFRGYPLHFVVRPLLRGPLGFFNISKIMRAAIAKGGPIPGTSNPRSTIAKPLALARREDININVAKTISSIEVATCTTRTIDTNGCELFIGPEIGTAATAETWLTIKSVVNSIAGTSIPPVSCRGNT